MDKEFEEKCLNKRTITLEPTVTKIEDNRIIQQMSKTDPALKCGACF